MLTSLGTLLLLCSVLAPPTGGCRSVTAVVKMSLIYAIPPVWYDPCCRSLVAVQFFAQLSVTEVQSRLPLGSSPSVEAETPPSSASQSTPLVTFVIWSIIHVCTHRRAQLQWYSSLS